MPGLPTNLDNSRAKAYCFAVEADVGVKIFLRLS